ADYLAAGARIDMNDPAPGQYRVQPGQRLTISKAEVSFTSRKVVPQPNLAYDVANTDVFRGLGRSITPITPAAILKDAHVLDGVASYVLANDPAPGVAPGDLTRWYGLLKEYASNGGTLVLT